MQFTRAGSKITLYFSFQNLRCSYRDRECVSKGAAGARIRSSFGTSPFAPSDFEASNTSDFEAFNTTYNYAPTDFEAQNSLL